MRIYFSARSDGGTTGAFSFARNLEKYLVGRGNFVISDWKEDFDVALVIGATTIERNVWKAIESRKIPIVFRIDNIPEDYRNRGTAISRMKDYSEWADVVVYQSYWAKEYVMGLTGRDGAVIYNGVDTNIYNVKNRISDNEEPVYLYVRSSTNENKRWAEAKYIFRTEWLKNDRKGIFRIVGNFADYIKIYGKDFVDRYKLGLFDEPYEYLGTIADPLRMAEVYKNSHFLIAPFFNDADSNVITEGLTCGCKLLAGTAKDSGGTPEIVKEFEKGRMDWASLDRMGAEYEGIFKLLKSI